MRFELDEAIEILSRTPRALSSLLSGISEVWVNSNEGPDTFSPFDVVGHLIQGERTDWLPRAELMLSSSGDKRFQPFDRFAQRTANEGKSMRELLAEFALLREQNIVRLRELTITQADLDATGIHPEFGVVTLRQHLSTWVVHDLDHLMQIARVMAKQYTTEVGPWVKYLKVLRS